MPDTLYVTEAGALALQATGIPGWALPVVNLCTAVPSPPGRKAVIADFTLATFSGYAAATCVFVGGYVDGLGGLAYMLSPLLSFPGPTSGAGANIAGWVLEDSSTHVVYAWGSFAAPVSLNSLTDLLSFLIQIFENETYNVVVVP